jgi:hypothetical protein
MFEQIAACDQLVIYDTVQLPKGGGKGRGFITRVQIKTAQGQKWLSVPIGRSGSGEGVLIKDARIADQRWRESHLGSIGQAYRQAPFFEWVQDRLLNAIYGYQTDSLVEFNMHAQRLIVELLGIERTEARSSDLKLEGRETASERVLEICELFGADEYLTGHGAANYLDHELFERAGVKVCYMDYQLTPYPQLHGPFLPYVSSLDLLFNVGPEARNHLSPKSVYWRDWVARS